MSSRRVLAMFSLVTVRTTFLGVTTAVIALLADRPADANGRFPASNQIVFSPTNENIIVGRATYAILPSNDNGKTWGYLCEDTLALPGANSFQDPEIGLTYNNAIVAGLYSPTVGLDVSNDLGCNWNCIGGPLANQQVADIVVRPDWTPDDSALGSTSHQVLALTNTYGASADAGTFSQVFQSPDDGATWTALSARLDPTVLSFATIDVAKTDPTRIYLSGNRNYGLTRTASLFVSMDNGVTWTEHRVPTFNTPVKCDDDPSMMCPSEDTLFIAGVDPTDENRVYLRSNGPTGTSTPGISALYVTTDGGQTFQVAKTFVLPPPNTDYMFSGEMLGFALSPDGSKVYIGTKETGLWAASKTDLAFTNVNCKVQVECLADRQLKSTGQEELWACSSEVGGFVFGKSTDEGVTFTPMMPTITSMSGPIACSGSGPTSNACFTDANASHCSCSGYQMFCTAYETSACVGCGQDGGGPQPASASSNGRCVDGGDSGGDASGIKTSGGRSSSSCGCSVVGGGGAAGFCAGCAIAAIALRRRRGRRR